MHCSQPFQEAAETYLRRYHEILDNMIAGMTGAELTDSISHNFIVQMIPHHRAAIEMSENLLQYSTLAPLQRIAQGIIQEQTRSIGDMEQALPCCQRQCNTLQARQDYDRCFQRITRTMFSRMEAACASGNIDADFLREMIPHHQGAIQMSQNALRFPICQELRPILMAIITSQERGVRQMQRLLRCEECGVRS